MTIWLDVDDTLVDYNLVEKSDGYADVPPLPGVVKFVQEKLQQGNEVYIISWYNKDDQKRIKEKYQWCLRNLPMVPYQNVVLIPRPSNKAKKAMEILGVGALTKNDMLIDDNPDNINAWKEAGGTPFLIDIKRMSWETFK